MLTDIYMLNGIYALNIYTAWSLEIFYDCWCIHAAEPVELPMYQASLCCYSLLKTYLKTDLRD